MFARELRTERIAKAEVKREEHFAVLIVPHECRLPDGFKVANPVDFVLISNPIHQQFDDGRAGAGRGTTTDELVVFFLLVAWRMN